MPRLARDLGLGIPSEPLVTRLHVEGAARGGKPGAGETDTLSDILVGGGAGVRGICEDNRRRENALRPLVEEKGAARI